MTLNHNLKVMLDQQLEDICKANHIPGMALNVYKAGEPYYEKYYGHRDVAKELPVTDQTIFPAASVTKSFTTLSVMILVDQGKLSVDDRVTDWLPELTLPDQAAQKRLKVHHLLTNTGGFPGLGAVNLARAESIEKDPDGVYMADRLSYNYGGRKIKNVVELMEVMSKDIDYSLLGTPGTVYNYSNEGFALLQEIIERASEESFVNFVQTHIFDPLEMSHSTFLTKDLKFYDEVTELYGYTKDFKAFHSPAWWDVGNIYTNGSLKTTVADLMKYLEVYRLKGTVKGQQIISKLSLKKMMGSHFTIPTGEGYGYGLKKMTYAGITLIGHPGNIKGGSAYIMYAKELGLTFAVLTNIGEFSAESIAMRVLKTILNRPSTESITEQCTLSEKDLQEYTGLFQSAEGRRITVSLKGGSLYLVARNNMYFISPKEKDLFVSESGAKHKFLRDDKGSIVGLFTGFRFIPKAKTKKEALHVTLN